MTGKGEQEPKGEEVQLVVFKLQGEEFGVEIGRVSRIVRLPEITKIPDAPSYIEGVINLMGEVIAVIDLAREFDLPPAERKKSSRIVVVEAGNKTVGMMVDEVTEVVKIAKAEIDPAPEIVQTKVKKEFVKGVGKLGERLLILLELNNILEPEKVSELEKAAKGAA